MSLVSRLPDVLLQEMDIYHYLLENPKFTPALDAVALINGPTGAKMTRGEVGRNARRFAHSLLTRWGWNEGHVLAILSPNSVEYTMILLGTLAARGIVTTGNPSYTASEFAHQLHDSAARLIITTPDLLPIALEAANTVGIPTSSVITVGESTVPEVLTLASILSSHEHTPTPLTPEETHDTTAYIVYSSGTSGLPKGVEMTHRNIVSNIQQFNAFEGPTPQNEVWGGILPFYHIYGLTVLLHCSFARGIPLVVVPKFEFVPFLRLITQYRITFSHVAPPVCLALAKHPAVPEHDLSSMRSVLSGAAPLDADLANAVTARTGIIVRQGYGMSETSPLVAMVPEHDVRPGSTGLLVPNITAKLIKADGSHAGIREEGEIWVKGPNIMKGYRNNAAATRDTIDSEGFLHTGDVAIRDADGHIYIVDRLKELIKFKGFQVAPAELEALLLTHPDIEDAAVIGVPWVGRATEIPKAFVVPRSNSGISEQQVIDFVASRLSAHKHVRGGVEFITAIPKSPSGKILRRLLRQQNNPPQAKL